MINYSKDGIANDSSHVDILDGLRGIAILMVVFFHFWQLSWISTTINIFGISLNFDWIVETGFIGVELFFFISGFVIFYPYARNTIEGYRYQTIKEFAIKRVRKIIPSYFLAIILIIPFIREEFTSFTNEIWHIFTHVIFVHNLFKETYYSINGVFWSLAVEVQFYILFPVILYAFRKKPIITYVSMCAIAIIYRYYIENYCQENFTFLLNQCPSFLDVFANGIGASYLLVYMRKKLIYIDKLKLFFTAGAIVSVITLIFTLKWIISVKYNTNGVKIWQCENRYLISILFLILTITLNFSENIVRKVFNNKLLYFFSIISYNLYIWHQFIGRQIKVYIEKIFVVNIQINNYWQVVFFIISILISIIISMVITFLFERKFIGKYGIVTTADGRKAM